MHVGDLGETQFGGGSLIMSRMISGLYTYHDNYEEWHGREDDIAQGRSRILGPSNKHK
jgi:hypothetical protein